MSAERLADAGISLSIPLSASPTKRNGETRRSTERQARWKRVLDDLDWLARLEADWDRQGPLPADFPNPLRPHSIATSGDTSSRMASNTI